MNISVSKEQLKKGVGADQEKLNEDIKYGQVRLVACQEELLPSQEQLNNDIGAIVAVQSKSERTVMLDKQLKGIIAKLNSSSRIYIRDLVASCRRHRCRDNSIQPRDHKSEARNAVDCGRSLNERICKEFHNQLKAVAEHNSWTVNAKVTKLLLFPQRQTANILQCPTCSSIPWDWTFRNGFEATHATNGTG
jgi:hypothetical protein